ncbi:MAG: tetratricopeptide repeat protein [Planctomycetaceae bacterium]|nr:tetratricopeptide repeat protein [Planctomycetaceae bacterium]
MPYALFLIFHFSFLISPLFAVERFDSDSCAQCHEKEHQLWKSSDHAKAMDHATPQTVLGDFRDSRFLHVGFDDIPLLQNEEIALLVGDSELTPRDFALALADGAPGVKEALARHISLDAEIEHLGRVGFTRPGEISIAQRKITDRLVALHDTGKIRLDFATSFRMFQKDDGFFITTEGRDGKAHDFPIKYVLGVRPLQQYLTEFPDGRIQCLPVAWDVAGKRWYHLYPKERILPNDPLHWTRPLQNWNRMCADCHTTELERNFDLRTNTFQTGWAEMRVGCRACHLPDISDTKNSTTRKECFYPSTYPANSHGLTTCLPCHTRRRNLTEGHLAPGDDFLDRYVPETPDRPIYYPDGQFLDENFEYGSFLQSRMYYHGVTCINCHDPHSIRPKFEGNRLCAQCHSPDIYDKREHHFHEAGAGDRCIDCHMPPAMYMITDKRYDHSMSKPRPELTLDLGVPNACNVCHHDREKGEDAAWAKAWTDKWYDAKRKGAVGYGQPKAYGLHHAYAVAKGRELDPAGVTPLIAVAKEENGRDIRPITRASAVALLGGYNVPQAKETIREMLGDPEGLVRLAAVSAMESWPIDQRLGDLAPMLRDPLRSVRIEAARILTPVPKQKFSQTVYDDWKNGVREYLESLAANRDTAPAHLNLAVFRYHQAVELWEAEKNPTRESFLKATEPVVKTYQTSIYLDPLFLPARVNLAMLYDERGESDAAEKEFRKALEIDPNQGEIHYSLALLLAQQNRFPESVASFEKAVPLLPNHARMRYNYGLALLKAGRTDDAKKQLTESLRLDPNSTDAALVLKSLER